MAKRRLSIALATCKKTYETAKDEMKLHRALQSLNIAIKFPVWSEEEEEWEGGQVCEGVFWEDDLGIKKKSLYHDEKNRSCGHG